MKNKLNVLLSLVFVLITTLYACKPKQVVMENEEQTIENKEQTVEQASNELEAPAFEIEIPDPCHYDAIKGKGIITKINFSNPDNVVIKFRFEQMENRDYRYPMVSDKEVLFNVDGSGNYPSRDWCEENGVKQGATFDCIRYELNMGSEAECETVRFTFPELENKGW